LPGFKLEDFPEAETREQVFQARNGGSDRPSGDFSREEKMKRASAYVAKMDPAIEGAGGDHRTYCAGAVVARDFDLSVEDAMEVLRPWNTRCQPPWVEHDLRKKIENALEYGTSTIGSKFEGLNGGGPRVVGSDPSRPKR
jgi:hypothetical protein